MTETHKNQLLEKIEVLKASLVGEMFADMEVKDLIHNLEMQLKGVKPQGSEFDCVGCGS
jgi:hypothetical protein